MLSVTAVEAGSLIRLANQPGGGVNLGTTAVAAGASATVGPYSIATRWEHPATWTYAVTKADNAYFAATGADASITATAAEVNRATDVSARIVSLAATPVTITEAAHDGKVLALNKADGITATLPAATGSGAKFTFIVGTTVTSNGYIIKVADATDVMDGIVYVADDTATPAPLVWVTAATSDTITLNGTTTGGLIGDRIELIDIATNQWAVTGFLKQSGTEATPFSATVS